MLILTGYYTPGNYNLEMSLLRNLVHLVSEAEFKHEERSFMPVITRTKKAEMEESIKQFMDMMREMKSGQDEMKMDIKQGQEEMKQGQDAIKEEMKQGQDAIKEEMKQGQDAIKEEMKQGQDAIKRRDETMPG
ncbi:hypothetical protein NQ317_007066 [Molorchus minor]|uniref:Uncharacterized protein n=1 Tax=Molorchus minor TaxID=1323400 RepID=A0ABQ9K4N3_9CUCU|nr:hypothetical protein NQ317_007066 [Molorchus minor]